MLYLYLVCFFFGAGLEARGAREEGQHRPHTSHEQGALRNGETRFFVPGIIRLLALLIHSKWFPAINTNTFLVKHLFVSLPFRSTVLVLSAPTFRGQTALRSYGRI